MKERRGVSPNKMLFLAAGAALSGALALGVRPEVKSSSEKIDLDKGFAEAESLPDHLTFIRAPREEFSEVESKERVEIILTGDVMLGRTVMSTSLDRADPTYPFINIGEALSEADITFINLENPIIEGCEKSYDLSDMQFCTRPSMVAGLSSSGIDIANLANNHILDHGEDGLRQTQEILEQGGIKTTGVGGLVQIRIGNTNFGFLGFDFVSKWPTDKDFQLVRESNEEVDVLLVAVHWGTEFQTQASELQREYAKRLVEEGADVIVGSYPHVVQERVSINGKLVLYSLGNLVFDQWFGETREGLVIRLEFEDGELVSIEEITSYMPSTSSWVPPEFVEK